jgi:hypothetical protein
MDIPTLTKFHKDLHDLFVQAATKLPSSERRTIILEHIQDALESIEQQIIKRRQEIN